MFFDFFDFLDREFRYPESPIGLFDFGEPAISLFPPIRHLAYIEVVILEIKVSWCEHQKFILPLELSSKGFRKYNATEVDSAIVLSMKAFVGHIDESQLNKLDDMESFNRLIPFQGAAILVLISSLLRCVINLLEKRHSWQKKEF